MSEITNTSFIFSFSRLSLEQYMNIYIFNSLYYKINIITLHSKWWNPDCDYWREFGCGYGTETLCISGNQEQE